MVGKEVSFRASGGQTRAVSVDLPESNVIMLVGILPMATARETCRKIAYYCASTRLGAAERGLIDLVGSLREQTLGWYRPWFILPRAEGPLVDRLVELELPHTILPMPKGLVGVNRQGPVRSLLTGALAWPALRGYMTRLEALVEDREPALIHSTGLRCHLLAARLGSGVPVLWHLSDYVGDEPARVLLRRLRKGARVHAITGSYALALALDPAEENPVVVFSGVDPNRFKPGSDPVFRSRFDVGEEVPIIGVVGLPRRGMGLRHFLEMAARLPRHDIDARFVVLPDEQDELSVDDEALFQLEKMATELGIGSLVEFVDGQEDEARALQGLDLLVSPATNPNSSGRIVVEALACAVPVVASAIGGVLDIVEDRVCGRLVPPEDVDTLTRAVAEMIEDEELRSGCVAAGRARAIERFGVDRFVGSVVRAYDRILGPGE